MNIEINSNEARLINDALRWFIEVNKKAAYKAKYYPNYCEEPEGKIKDMVHDNLVIETLIDRIGLVD